MTAALLVAVAVLAAGGLAQTAARATRHGHVRARLAVGDRAMAHRSSRSARPLRALVRHAGRRRTITVAPLAAWHRTAERRRRPGELADVLDDVARRVRAGDSLLRALEHAAAAAPSAAGHALGQVALRVELGVSWEASLRQLMADADGADVRLVASALEVAVEAGGHTALALEAVAASLRERRAASQEVLAQSAQARLSAVVIAVLPVGFAGWCVATDDRAAAFLLATPAGWACVTAGLALLAAGAWWMSRIIGSVS